MVDRSERMTSSLPDARRGHPAMGPQFVGRKSPVRPTRGALDVLRFTTAGTSGI